MLHPPPSRSDHGPDAGLTRPHWLIVLGLALAVAMVGAPIARALNADPEAGELTAAENAAVAAITADPVDGAGIVGNASDLAGAGIGAFNANNGFRLEAPDPPAPPTPPTPPTPPEEPWDKQLQDEYRDAIRDDPNEPDQDDDANALLDTGVQSVWGGWFGGTASGSGDDDSGSGTETGLVPKFGGTAPFAGFDTGLNTGSDTRTLPDVVTLPGASGFPPIAVDLPGWSGTGGSTGGGFDLPPELTGADKRTTGDLPVTDRDITTTVLDGGSPAMPAWAGVFGQPVQTVLDLLFGSGGILFAAAGDTDGDAPPAPAPPAPPPPAPPAPPPPAQPAPPPVPPQIVHPPGGPTTIKGPGPNYKEVDDR
jgi:hypothetical protein